MAILGVIADDFTGATDIAGMLVKGGMRTIQTIGVPAKGTLPDDVDAVVVALKSRSIAAREAIEQSLAALKLTLAISGIVVLLNAVMGTVVAWVLVRQRFHGRALLNALVDLPFALSPVTVGLACVILFGPGGWFAPFFQARGAYDRRHDGTGLGVSIVQGLVMLHGGTMDIASRVGEGTRVTVRLPVDCEGVRPHRDRKSEVAHPSFERMSAFDLQEKIVDKNQVKKSA